MRSIAHPQFSSAVLCLGLSVQSGSIVDLFAAVLVRLIFSVVFWPSMVSLFLGIPEECCLVTLLCGFPCMFPIHFHLFPSDLDRHPVFLSLCP